VLSAKRFLLLRTMMRRLAVRARAFSEADLECYADALSQPGALRAALAYYRANIRREPMAWARASRVEAETLVIWGLDDPGLSPVLLDGLASVAPNSRVHRVPDCGHWVQSEAASEVNGLMVDFLARR
jgi:pimeloyl-ACP methyl ester carboxylesterase